jgi:hypothetical protein
MRTTEKFSNAINYLTNENKSFANSAILEVAKQMFTLEEWVNMTPKQREAFRVAVIGKLAIEMAFEA